VKVDDLQDMISVIRQLLVSAGAGGKGADLAEFIAALDPFRSLTVKQLAKELHKLTNSAKDGGKGPSLSSAEVESLISTIHALYERAGSPDTSQEEVEELTQPLFALKKKPDIVRAAEAIGLKVAKNKSIAKIATDIRKRILNRMGSKQKVDMINVLGVDDE
jgi:hypothetical protein